jgi:channel protein (hemolysin III family)
VVYGDVSFFVLWLWALCPFQPKLLGGLCYTVGAVFYAWEQLTFNHAVWHLSVLLDSILHFFSVFSTCYRMPNPI